MSSIVKRLSQYIEHKGISVSVAEKEIGISNGSLSKPFKSNTTIKTDALEKFLKTYIDINPNWLLNGAGSMLKNTAEFDKLNFKELSEARAEIIEGLKYKISSLEKEISELKQQDQDKSKSTLVMATSTGK